MTRVPAGRPVVVGVFPTFRPIRAFRPIQTFHAVPTFQSFSAYQSVPSCVTWCF
ncbi:hypothetical protein ACWDOR_12970 [Streptosporangium canum]|uniref:hypothetical protein n=1 Tax=Streptosporangium canum TaxID=324952 RepID=UPI0036A57AE2